MLLTEQEISTYCQTNQHEASDNSDKNGVVSLLWS